MNTLIGVLRISNKYDPDELVVIDIINSNVYYINTLNRKLGDKLLINSRIMLDDVYDSDLIKSYIGSSMFINSDLLYIFSFLKSK